jgi:cytochrome P450
LTYTFYHLTQNPDIVKKLREEVTPLIKGQTDFNIKDAQNAQFLNGIIFESLRLHPPVPSGVQRLTPPEGIYVGNTFIPGDTTVLAPSYSMGRREYRFIAALR